mmetsp:Transcript_20012/g.37786  ORF Transcript_20012/g.37786 Transcript_20012/m.37786 type:complete len:1085 (+) Transcript_20012:104-3358(+)
MGQFEGEPGICEEGGGGLLLPLFPGEQEWDAAARAFLYFIALSWCFIGVAIIADIFMASIEAVTSKRRNWRLKNGQVITVKLWNDTVANLTLMALGSSAPEILLNVIEIIGADFYAGELGPSTIVGSAAFNLMVIIAVCVVVIPEGESRTIEQPEPFVITALFSVFAYVWMVIILAASTPDSVSPAEGIMTFAFFPILVTTAWLADVGWLTFKKADEEDHEVIQQKVLEAGYSLSAEEVKKLARLKTAEMNSGHKSHAHYRQEVGTFGYGKSISPKELSVGFISARYSFHNGMQTLMLEVEKTGDNPKLVMDTRVGFDFRTVDGTMRHEAGHYQAVAGCGEIPAGVQYGEILIQRKPGDLRTEGLESELVVEDSPKDRGGEADLHFFYVELLHVCKLSAPTANKTQAARMTKAAGAQDESDVELQDLAHHTQIPILPELRKTQVNIGSSTGAGQLRFHLSEMDVPGPEFDTPVRIKVRRISGTQGEIGCNFTTESDTAKAGIDFQHTEGDLLFPAGVAELNIDVTVYKKPPGRARNLFYIIISESPGRSPVIAEELSVCTVTIHDTKSAVGTSSKVVGVLQQGFPLETISQAGADWADQFYAALRPGSGEEDEKEQATTFDWALHAVTLPWKLLFAFTPPTSYCDGWATFVVGLCFIGLITCLIGDLARLLGCVLKISDQITAITFVALGTSLPDTFASKVAAVQDPSADAAIGNVTGSNSVNVFLGLGLPWMMASLKWAASGPNDLWRKRYPVQSLKYPKGAFIVLSGDLCFTVVLFCICSFSVLSVIWFRRVTFQAELGGPTGVKTNTSIFFGLLWIFYVSLASWKVINGPNASTGSMVLAVTVGFIVVLLGMVVVSSLYFCYQELRKDRQQGMRDMIDEMHDIHRELRHVEAAVAYQRGGGVGGHGSIFESATGSMSPGALVKNGPRTRPTVQLINGPSWRPDRGGYDPLPRCSVWQNGSPGNGVGRNSLTIQLDGDSPQDGSWDDLPMVDAVSNLRQHIEALNSVCCQMEAQVGKQDGSSGDAARSNLKLKKMSVAKKSRIKKAASQGQPAENQAESSPGPETIGKTGSAGAGGPGLDKE